MTGYDGGAAELQRTRELILHFGWNATCYQILNPGIRHWFSERGDAVVGYVLCHDVRVVAGAPVAPRDRLAQVADEFCREARHRGERVCYFCAEERLGSLYATAPSHSWVSLGAQPAWDPALWPAIPAHHASLRAQFNRARNKGVEVTEWSREHARGNPELQRCLREWLATRGLPPLHFLIEPQTLDRLYDRRIFVAERNGTACGFLVASPIPQRKGWLVEQFVRGRGAPNGTAELMIDTAMRALANSSYVTLGLSPLSHRGERPPDRNPIWLRLMLEWVRAHGRRFYNFGGLERFKAKFDPVSWEPIYAIANQPTFSPGMLYAIAEAFAAGSPIALVARALADALRSEARWLGDRVRPVGGR